MILAAPHVSTPSYSRTWNSKKVPPAAGKIALFALAIALVLGAVFYGLNNSSINQAGTTPPAQTAQQTRAVVALGPAGHA